MLLALLLGLLTLLNPAKSSAAVEEVAWHTARYSRFDSYNIFSERLDLEYLLQDRLRKLLTLNRFGLCEEARELLVEFICASCSLQLFLHEG